MEHWVVPRCFAGRTVCVMASGESLTHEDADAVRAAGIPCVAINNTFRRAPWSWALYAADTAWWKHEDNLDAHGFDGLKISVEKINGVHQLQNSGTTGFDPNPSSLRTGGNGGYQGVHLMAHTGASRILLLGFDMRGTSHWHGMHPAPLRNTDPEHYPAWIERFKALDAALKARGIEVINCTPGSALNVFPMASLADCLSRAMNIGPIGTSGPLGQCAGGHGIRGRAAPCE